MDARVVVRAGNEEASVNVTRERVRERKREETGKRGRERKMEERNKDKDSA